MEIDKLNENNIKKYMNDTEHNYNLNANRGYFGIKKDGKFIGGYDFSDDWISIFFRNDISCDLEGQNIKDKEVIAYLDKYFVSLKVKVINFIVASECLDYVKNLGYEECIKKFIIN